MMSNEPKTYNLEARTLAFSKEVRDFVNSLPYSLANREYAEQLIRSSSSIGANYIEANECLGKKDFLMRIKISKKESKESMYWLNLIASSESSVQENLKAEAVQLMKIFGSILSKSRNLV